MVKVSIIMPVYNGAEFLKRSIESVSKQTLKDLELICVDDGSTDNSLEVLNDLSNQHDFINIITQENAGAGSARNNGIKNSKGEYIAFLDADDEFFDDDALEKMVNSNTTDADMVSANLLMIDNDEVVDNFFYTGNDYRCFLKNELIEPQEYGAPLSFYKNIFKREFLIGNNIFFPDFRRGQDPPFLAKILTLIDRIQCVPVNLYGHHFLVDGGAENKINTPEKLRGYIQHFKDTCDILANGGLNDLSDFYKIHLFRFLTRDENINNEMVYELFDEIFGIENPTFDETDFNYVRFIVPASFYFINKLDSEEFYIKVNKKFLTFNIYDTFAITDDIIDKYLLVIYSYSLDDFKSNHDKYMANNLKFIEKFMKFKIDKFTFNLEINPTDVVIKNAKNAIQNYHVWKNRTINKELLKKSYNLIETKFINYSKDEIIEKLNNNEYSDLTIAIKSPNPIGHHHWGDYFVSLALKKSFEKKGFRVIIQELEEWYDNPVKVDINIVLRGLEKYMPKSNEINIMWNISHPDLVKKEEFELYDICFISSVKQANNLKGKINTVIEPLLQCTDPEVFFTEKDESISEDLLFVGVTRGVYREIIKDVMQTDFDVSIYGLEWENFVDEKYIKGQFIPNNELHKYYSSCKILLNDHWEDMRDMNFPSNRLFDALACGTFVISDKIKSADTIFEGSVVTYDGVEDLNNKIEYYLNHNEERVKITEKGKDIVLKNHTYDKRVEEILQHLKNL